MTLAIDPFRLLLISLAGWLNQRQQDVIDYLQQENRVLHEQLGGQRLRSNPRPSQGALPYCIPAFGVTQNAEPGRSAQGQASAAQPLRNSQRCDN